MNNENYVRIDGLQISNTLSYASSKCGIDNVLSSTGADIRISNCIIKETTAYAAAAIRFEYVGGSNAWNAYVWSNIIYDWKRDVSGWGQGITVNENDWTVVAYNNTIVDCNEALVSASGTMKAVNNTVKGCGDTDSYIGTFAAGTDYNATDSADNIGTGSNNHTGHTFLFVDEDNDDYHLQATDTGAKDYGNGATPK